MASRWCDVARTPSTRPVKFQFNFYAESAPSASLQPFQDRQAATFMFFCAFIMICSTILQSWTCLRGASRSRDAVRMASISENKPPSGFSDGDESRRWREGTAAPRDAEIVLQEEDAIFKVVHLVM